MLSKYLICCLFIGAVICFSNESNFWLVTSSCSPHCTVLPSKGVYTPFCPDDKPITPNDCSKAAHYVPFTEIQDLPILTATRVTCKSYTIPEGTYYKWINQTGDKFVQKWKCFDSGCLDCVTDGFLRSTPKPVPACQSMEDTYSYVTEGLPNMSEFYPKHRDPNRNWYRMEIGSYNCKPEIAKEITYYPWQTFITATQDYYKVEITGKCVVETAEFCGFDRCTSQDTIATYYFATDDRGFTAPCDFNVLDHETSSNLTNCQKCLKL